MSNFMIVIGYLSSNSVNIFVGYKTSKIEDTLLTSCYNINNDVEIIQQIKPYNNYTTVFHCDNLLPQTTYTFSLKLYCENLGTISTKTICITTQSIESNKIIVGLCSCHYPNPLQVSDKIFKAFDHVLEKYQTKSTPVIFQVGDQVYADQLNRLVPIKRVDQHTEFIKLYEDKYTGKHFSNFTSKYSSVMTLDDHEIEDNWSLDRIQDRRDLFLTAIRNYKIYQISHSPLYCGKNIENSRLFYNINIGGFPFFILDSRTERNNQASNLISEYQFNSLCTWLKSLPNDVPKFIVSSVIFAPFNVNVLDDKLFKKTGISFCDNWNGYSTKNKLLQYIADNDIQKIIFLSGDIHNSLAVSINLERKNKVIKMYQIISSPLYWPFPFANGNIGDYILNTKDLVYYKDSCSLFNKSNSIKLKIKDSKNKTWQYTYVCDSSTHSQLNNFAILEIMKEKVEVKWYNNNEEEIAKFDIIF